MQPDLDQFAAPKISASSVENSTASAVFHHQKQGFPKDHTAEWMANSIYCSGPHSHPPMTTLPSDPRQRVERDEISTRHSNDSCQWKGCWTLSQGCVKKKNRRAQHTLLRRQLLASLSFLSLSSPLLSSPFPPLLLLLSLSLSLSYTFTFANVNRLYSMCKFGIDFMLLVVRVCEQMLTLKKPRQSIC